MNFLARLTISVLILGTSYLFAHGKNHHVNDMWDVFPFSTQERNGANKKANDFFEDVHSYIDYCEYPLPTDADYDRTHFCHNLCELLSNENECPLEAKSISFGDHRMFYHWGWVPGSDLEKNRHYKALRENVSIACSNNRDCEKRFFDMLTDQKRKRDKHLRDQYAVFIGKNNFENLSKREQKEGDAFISVLYAVHILGDYTTVQGDKHTQTFKSLINDLDKAFSTLAGGRTSLANNLTTKITLATTSTSSDPNDFFSIHQKGQIALRILKEEFKDFLYECGYKKKFKDLNYKLK